MRTARARRSPGTCSTSSSRPCPVHRMVFHEITPDAIAEAVANPREINNDLVEAQEARRILDRLYGYEVSPVLWKKVMSGLSAGRVQSVATRLVVDRERERMAFRAAAYWDLEATFDAGESQDAADVPGQADWSVDGRRVAQGRDFTSLGVLKDGADVVHLDGDRAGALAAGLQRAELHGLVGRGQAVPALAVRAVPDDHAAAGGVAQARLRLGAHDADRAAAVRERPHHLYADRLGHAVRHRDPRRPRPGDRAVRPRLPARRAAHLPEQGQERAGGARGDPARPATRSARRRRPASTATTSGSTS